MCLRRVFLERENHHGLKLDLVRARDLIHADNARLQLGFDLCPSLVGDLVELIGWATFLGYACLGLVLALVATTTVMAMQDRVRIMWFAPP